jgi:hypothetical protein
MSASGVPSGAHGWYGGGPCSGVSEVTWVKPEQSSEGSCTHTHACVGLEAEHTSMPAALCAAQMSSHHRSNASVWPNHISARGSDTWNCSPLPFSRFTKRARRARALYTLRDCMIKSPTGVSQFSHLRGVRVPDSCMDVMNVWCDGRDGRVEHGACAWLRLGDGGPVRKVAH